MLVITRTTRIDAPVEDVWAVLSDVGSFPRWNPIIRRFTGELTLGADSAIHVGPQGENVWAVHVETMHAPHELAWTFVQHHRLLYRGQHRFRLDSLNDGRTHLIDTETFWGLLVPLRKRRLTRDINLSMQAMADALKTRVESDGPNPITTLEELS